MADRKKVRRVRPKRTVKFKGRSDATKNTERSSKKKDQPIEMSSLADASDATPEKSNVIKKKTQVPVRRSKISSSNNANSKGSNKQNTGLSVINGKKNENQKKRLITICVSFIIIASILIFWLTSPTGPIERITNAFTIMGGGDYPAVLTGTKVVSLQNVNNKSFILTNSHLCGYNLSGKNFLLLQHNFSNPVLDVSQERTLIYNRESNRFIIANNSGPIFEESLDQSIFCADIADNGSVAFVSDSTSYSAQISIFDKNMKQYYSWYLADGLVSDISLSNNGKYIALAVLKVKDGVFSSEIYCLNTSEKDPIFIKKLEDETIFKIESVSSSNFVYVSDKKVNFVDWETGESSNKNIFESPSYFDKISDFYLALYGEANHSDVILYDDSGEVEHQFEYNGIIDGISIYDEKIYILSGNKITYWDFVDKNENIINLEGKSDFIIGIDDGVLSINNINIDFISVK